MIVSYKGVRVVILSDSTFRIGFFSQKSFLIIKNRFSLSNANDSLYSTLFSALLISSPLRMSSLPSSSTTSMSLAEKTAYAEKLEELLRVKLIKIAHYDQCVLIEIAATLALNQFQRRYTHEMIISDPLLQAEETRLTAAKTKAWNDRFAAESAAYPPTLESLLWIVAKSGFTKEVAPFMNLSKATRECKNLQRVMREVMNWGRYGEDRGRTQLFYFCSKGMTSSVMRMLEMKSIDVEARRGGSEDVLTCIMTAAA